MQYLYKKKPRYIPIFCPIVKMFSSKNSFYQKICFMIKRVWTV